MGKADSQAPWTVVMTARQIVKLRLRLIGNLVVIFELVGDLGGTCVGNRTEIVIPPVDALTGLAVVGRPAEIGGIDVGREALFEAVQLIGSDEVHLAGKSGLVACIAQMMRIGRNFRRELCGIVENARPEW